MRKTRTELKSPERQAEVVLADISKGESDIWAEDTKFTPEELESLYVNYYVEALRNEEDLMSFSEYCVEFLGIKDDFEGGKTMVRSESETIVVMVRAFAPLGVSDDDARKYAKRMKPGSSLFLETSFQGKSGRLVLVKSSEPVLMKELLDLTETSGRWFLIARL